MLRCAYVDLDGTMTGRGGSLMHDAAGEVSLMAARALEAAYRAGVEIVPVSGRRRDTVREPARAMGCTAFGFELGGGLHVDGEDLWQSGALQPQDGQSVRDQIVARGVLELLAGRFPGRIELHAPWHTGREVTVLLRGNLDVDAANQLLADHGSDDLHLVDNGYVGGLPQGGTDPGALQTTLDPSLTALRSYHLAPREVGKAAAVERHRTIRGYERGETISVGDSAEDVSMADATATFWLVGGAHVASDPAVLRAMSTRENVRRAEGGPGDAVYEAIVTTLMLGRERQA